MNKTGAEYQIDSKSRVFHLSIDVNSNGVPKYTLQTQGINTPVIFIQEDESFIDDLFSCKDQIKEAIKDFTKETV